MNTNIRMYAVYINEVEMDDSIILRFRLQFTNHNKNDKNHQFQIKSEF